MFLTSPYIDQAIALIDVGGESREDSLLENERHATAYRACRLHQVHCFPIVPQNRERKKESWNRKKRV